MSFYDTNVWISFLIRKRLSFIKNYISSGKIIIVTTDQLLSEIKEVTNRERIKKYFPQENVKDLLNLLDNIAEKVEIKETYFINREPKDNFLLDLIDYSKTDHLITGDKDLLVNNPFKTAIILTPSDFEIALSSH